MAKKAPEEKYARPKKVGLSYLAFGGVQGRIPAVRITLSRTPLQTLDTCGSSQDETIYLDLEVAERLASLLQRTVREHRRQAANRMN